jgi:hypothetical protein
MTKAKACERAKAKAGQKPESEKPMPTNLAKQSSKGDSIREIVR